MYLNANFRGVLLIRISLLKGQIIDLINNQINNNINSYIKFSHLKVN